jgi:hypothetical protein
MSIQRSATICASTFAALLLCVGLASASAGGRMHLTTALTATAKAPNAHGRAQLDMKSVTKGRLRISTRGLAASSSFDVVMNGVKVGTLTTNAGGKGKLTLSTHPKRHAGLMGGDPRGDHLEVRDHDGDDDLECHFPGGDQPEIACCVPSEGATECDLETPDECTNEGGTPAGSAGGAFVSSCIPNPCAPTPPPPGGSVCCIPSSAGGAFVSDGDEPDGDADDVTCQEIDAMACGMAGGMVVVAASCDPNPCVPVQPPVVPCCLSGEDDDDVQCVMLTADHCTANHGIVSDATSCQSSPCGGGGDDDNQGDDNQGDDNQGNQGGDHHHGGDGGGDGGD